jgi:hypothetical protein
MNRLFRVLYAIAIAVWSATEDEPVGWTEDDEAAYREMCEDAR